jgi:hypothetical protein
MTTLMKQLYWPWLFSSPFSPSGSCLATHTMAHGNERENQQAGRLVGSRASAGAKESHAQNEP